MRKKKEEAAASATQNIFIIGRACKIVKDELRI